ncbi:hypothetical protein LXL04_026673 [Taraxacum kok-saghyz]
MTKALIPFFSIANDPYLSWGEAPGYSHHVGEGEEFDSWLEHSWGIFPGLADRVRGSVRLREAPIVGNWVRWLGQGLVVKCGASDCQSVRRPGNPDQQRSHPPTFRYAYGRDRVTLATQEISPKAGKTWGYITPSKRFELWISHRETRALTDCSNHINKIKWNSTNSGAKQRSYHEKRPQEGTRKRRYEKHKSKESEKKGKESEGVWKFNHFVVLLGANLNKVDIQLLNLKSNIPKEIVNPYLAHSNFVADKVNINFNVFGSLMLNRVGGEVSSTNIITVHKGGMSRRLV